jgi:hypothetical protein
MKKLVIGVLSTVAATLVAIPGAEACSAHWTRGNKAFDYYMDVGINMWRYYGDYDSAIINFRRAYSSAKTPGGRRAALCLERSARGEKYIYR